MSREEVDKFAHDSVRRVWEINALMRVMDASPKSSQAGSVFQLPDICSGSSRTPKWDFKLEKHQACLFYITQILLNWWGGGGNTGS